MVSSERLIDTPHGEGRMVIHRARKPIATLLLSHGAGNGIEARDLVALAETLPLRGNDVTVVLFEQPWRRAGRRVATAPSTLDDGLVAAANALRTRTQLVLGGRSAGARSAARTARGVCAAGCLALAFPLHPPGKPEKSRVDELTNARVRTLVVQGERDAFGDPSQFPAKQEIVAVPGADHGFKVPARGEISQQDALDIIVEGALEWIVREVVGNGRAT